MNNRRLMQEQEKAYKESAERDKQKILEVKKAKQEKLEAEKKQKKKQNEMEQRRQKRDMQVIAEMRKQLKLQGEHQPIGNDLINVQVRFPSGKKFAKKFALDDNLEKLFTAILCHDTCPDFFTVATGFPRSEIHCAPEWYHSLLSAQLVADGLAPSPFRPASSFRAVGLVKAVGVFVNNHCPYSDHH
ncbi:unnamed protein product [Angiostrongylus costaricensis]|uniref:UBX domain-containing protein n=1 Tax=Angiostrongylus costaricensis TaxID=334426 RepID=A0A158PJE3_ANGCS|nr:unnamed protein product [Angiostrongylus costaricensis]